MSASCWARWIRTGGDHATRRRLPERDPGDGVDAARGPAVVCARERRRRSLEGAWLPWPGEDGAASWGPAAAQIWGATGYEGGHRWWWWAAAKRGKDWGLLVLWFAQETAKEKGVRLLIRFRF